MFDNLYNQMNTDIFGRGFGGGLDLAGMSNFPQYNQRIPPLSLKEMKDLLEKNQKTLNKKSKKNLKLLLLENA